MRVPAVRQLRLHEERNRETAQTILAAAYRFGGTDAFPAIWARLYLKRFEDARKLCLRTTHEKTKGGHSKRCLKYWTVA
jgi:hypothetical protein